MFESLAPDSADTEEDISVTTSPTCMQLAIHMLKYIKPYRSILASPLR